MSYIIYTRGQESSSSVDFAISDRSELEKIIDQAELDANRLLYKPRYLHLIILKSSGGKYEYTALITESMAEFSAMIDALGIQPEWLLNENRAECILFANDDGTEYTASSILNGDSNMSILSLEHGISEYTNKVISKIVEQEERVDGQKQAEDAPAN
ncbi:hypothetical protein [uncultured Duncaniella sp.]|uniref:hypothetical protein n=1 Tax=uncultured Duncaniella sp. TaxID=2768039 RepID=UPI00262C4A65|nr:hypothetical protein [uncultured Duncaniella sp.]